MSKRPINCDQVAWMLAAINRYLPPQYAPNVSRAREMQGYALLYELMEVANLHFEDARSAANGTPKDVSMLRFPDKQTEVNAQADAQTQCEVMAGGVMHGQELDGQELASLQVEQQYNKSRRCNLVPDGLAR